MGSIEIGAKIFQNGFKDVLEKYPKLRPVERNGTEIVSGEIDLRDTDGLIIDTYSIEIYPSEKFPFRFPYVFETGGKIPINIDWHIFEKGGNCCIKIPPEEILICKNGITLLGFIDDEVLPYFFNQTFRRMNGYFLYERSHGIKGILEFYSHHLSTNNKVEILKLLYFIQQDKEPIRVQDCFCGSGKKYRKCHRDAFRLLSGIGQEQLKTDITLIYNSLG